MTQARKNWRKSSTVYHNDKRKLEKKIFIERKKKILDAFNRFEKARISFDDNKMVKYRSIIAAQFLELIMSTEIDVTPKSRKKYRQTFKKYAKARKAYGNARDD